MKVPPEQNIEPDRWAVIEFTNGDEKFRKILSGWNGGYFDKDSWRLSSPIVDETEMKAHIEFLTDSGSSYKCVRSGEGLTGLTREYLSKIQEQVKQEDNAVVKLLCYGDQT